MLSNTDTEGLVLENVEICYQGVLLVVRGISLQVAGGKIVTLLGANGAGKSTTLKAISGLLVLEEGKVISGSISFDGSRIENGDPEMISKLGIIQVMEGRRIFGHLSVYQNLLAASSNAAEFERGRKIINDLFPRLKDLSARQAGYISGGEQQMLAIARALIAFPKLLLLDEPSLGLAPLLVQEIYRTIRTINEEQRIPILLVEQNARVALDVAHYGYVMENGRLVLDGTTDKLRSNEDIKEFYLGLSDVGQRKHYREVKHYRRRKRWV